MLVVVCAGKAAPGASTLATALALQWPREVLLVDADPAGGDVVPGLLPGRVVPTSGLLAWSQATRRTTVLQALDLLAQHVVVLPEAPGVWLMPGLQTAAQAGLVAPAWPRLGQALCRVSGVLGRDVIVDAGRLNDQGSAWPVVAGADRIVMVTRGTARAAAGTADALDVLRRKVGDTDRVGLAVVQSGPYAPSEVRESLGGNCPLVAVVPDDRRAAAALSDGAVMGLGRLRRSKLLRVAGKLAGELVTIGARLDQDGVNELGPGEPGVGAHRG